MKMRASRSKIPPFLLFFVLFFADPVVGYAAAGMPSSTRATEASRTLDHARELIEKGSYAEAEDLARELLAEIEAAHGEDSVQAADVLDVVVEALWRGGKGEKPATRALAERSLRIREERGGSKHPDTAKSLRNLAIGHMVACCDCAKPSVTQIAG